MRITAIEIENFKGIGERVRVDLAPITLLFGANSAGKSTVLHALLYLRDVLERRNLDAITTPVSGAALDLGGIRQFVYGRDLGRTIKIRVDMELVGAELPDMAEGYPSEVTLSRDSGDMQDSLDQAQSRILQSIRAASVEIEVLWDEAEQAPVPFAYTIGLNGSDFFRLERDASKLKLAKLDYLNSAVTRPYTEQEIKDNRIFLLDLDDLTRGPLEPIEEDRHEQLIRTVFAGIQFRDSPATAGLRNWLPEPRDPIPDFEKQGTLHLPEVDWESFGYWNNFHHPLGRDIATSWAWEGTAFLAKLIIGPGQMVRDWLRNLRYVGPLRARPPRKGIPDAELNDWAEGLAAWKTLEQMPAEQFKEVSDWLSGKERLNTGYGLVRQRRVELDGDALDHVLAGRPTKAQFRALLKKAAPRTQVSLLEIQAGLELAPSEVGVGLSQVLPVVVATLDSPKGLVSIEQPELHIHPAMQIALGDLFMEGALKKGTQFIVETHSEHLILRLLRRIREAGERQSDAADPDPKPEDVAVIWVERTAEGVQMTRLPIDSTGEFTTRWPRGFFEERAGELF